MHQSFYLFTTGSFEVATTPTNNAKTAKLLEEAKSGSLTQPEQHRVYYVSLWGQKEVAVPSFHGRLTILFRRLTFYGLIKKALRPGKLDDNSILFLFVFQITAFLLS